MSGSVSTIATNSKTAPDASISQKGTTALGSLSNNFSDFLGLLMTQLKSQDPSSPMDSTQFTSQLVQFSSVEQQINTNGNLTQLIQLTQASQIEQSASMIGKPVTVSSPKLSLQNGSATVNFNTTNAQPVSISIQNAAGAQVQTAMLTSNAGANSWSWNGKGANGTTMPDGAYSVSLTNNTGASAAIPFTVTGTATSVLNQSGTVEIQMGGLRLPFSAVQSVGS